MPRLTDNDRRRDVRVPKRVPVVILSGEFEGMFVETEDVSLGGVSIKMERLLKVGTDIMLQFHLPTSGMPIEVNCRVASIKEQNEVGIEFVDLDPDAESEIWNYMISDTE